MEVSRIKKDWPKNPEHELEAYIYEFEDAKIQWRDFSGEYNGQINFSLLIEDEEVANRLIDDGLNVKILAPKEEGDPVRWTLKVIVNMNDTTRDGRKRRVPEVHRIDSKTHKNRVLTDAVLVSELDRGSILVCDIQTSVKYWDGTGYSVYLNWGQFVVEADREQDRQGEMASKYAPEDPDMPF